MYLELINRYRTAEKYDGTIKPGAPAEKEKIAAAEKRLGVRFPQELRDMLLEMDGDCNLLFSVEELLEYNLHGVLGNCPENGLLFIGSDGAGGLYGYAVKNGAIENTRLVFYDHETEEIYDDDSWGASSLYDLIKAFYDTCYGELPETAR